MDSDKQRIMGYFIEEAKEHLQTLEEGLLNLQSTVADTELVNEVFRAAHSIKGGAAMLGLTSIQKTAHRLEDCLKVLKENPVTVDQKVESMFLRGYDTLQDLLDRVQGPFGLREEEGEQALQEVEPTFTQLFAYLEQLTLSKEGGVVAEAAPPPSPPVNYSVQVTGILREMLALFKQPPTPETKQKLLGTCDRLTTLATESEQWQALTKASKRAIELARVPYQTLAPIVVKDLKTAGDLLQNGQGYQIGMSAHLRKLAQSEPKPQPTPEPRPVAAVAPMPPTPTAAPVEAKPPELPTITVPLEPKAAAQVLIKSFNKKQLLQLVQILYKVLKP